MTPPLGLRKKERKKKNIRNFRRSSQSRLLGLGVKGLLLAKETRVQIPRPAKIATRFFGISGHLATILTSKMAILAMVTIWPALDGHILAISAIFSHLAVD